MQVLPIIPLYPSIDYLTYNVSLGIPGPNLYNIPSIGLYAKENGFPNTKTSILFPDIEFISKFANYDLGIGKRITEQAKNSVISKIKTNDLKKSFSDNFDRVSSDDSMGLVALEKSIISSIFESQKPYLSIAQIAIESIIKIEDIIARTAPLIGASVNPLMAMSIRSLKPEKNGPSENNIMGLTKNGSPTSIGFKSNDDIFKNINKLKTLIDNKNNQQNENSNYSIPSLNIYSSVYTYVTISSVYSTLVYDSKVNYKYTFIDIPMDIETPTTKEAIDVFSNKKPERIILGIYDINGYPINPSDYEMEWVFTEKWILDKSINKKYYWETIDNESFFWKKGDTLIIQNESPGKDFNKLKYKDVIDYNNSNNNKYKYKEDDVIVSFTQSIDINIYREYFNNIAELEVSKSINIDTQYLYENIKSLYSDDKINEYIQNVYKFGKLKSSNYKGYDKSDIDSNIFITIPKNLKKSYKPMKFKMGNEFMWINPEADYDLKVIQISPSDKMYNNNHLKTNKLLSKGVYGVGVIGGSILDEKGNLISKIEESPIGVGFKERRKLNDDDKSIYYIVEGIRSDLNKESDGNVLNNINVNGSDYYNIFDSIGILPVLISLGVDIFGKLIPEINKLISLIKDPSNFISNIVLNKVTDIKSGFSIFSKSSISILSDLNKSSEMVKKGLMDVSKLKDIVSKSTLNNFIHVNKNGDFKFLLDGSAIISFFNLSFGIKVDYSDISPLTLIKKDDNKSNSLNRDINNKINNSTYKNVDSSSIISNSGDDYYYQNISIFYPNGFKENVKYNYIYTNIGIDSLLKEAEELSNTDYEKSIQKYQSIIDIERKKGEELDSNGNLKIDISKINQPLIASIQNTINDLKNKINISNQPIFKMVLGMASSPLKIIINIIKELVDIFKGMLNPFTMPQKITEFLSFKWILKFFNVDEILKLMGIRFNPEKASEWCILSNVLNPLYSFVPGTNKYLIPDDYPIANMSEFFDVDFLAKLPTYNSKQFRDMCNKSNRLLTPILCFFEKIINSFIMLIWSVMGISAIIPPPLIKLCRDFNENIKPEDMKDIINGSYKDNTISSNESNKSNGDSYKFIYDIKLEDGRIIRNLDYESLQKFIENNKDINFSTID